MRPAGGEREHGAGSDRRPHRRLWWLVAILNAVVLILTAEQQIYDTNFYSLWEATALLAGDHPYRDFFEWGVPLQAFVSLGAQVASGNRLIGEFALQWLGIAIGAVVSFHLGLRASGSRGWSLAMLALTVPLVAVTPTYHYPKLLVYPVALWLIWRYMDAPGARHAAFVGMAGAVAFLFRHDHGVYVAAAAAVAFILTRLVASDSRDIRAGLVEAGVCAAAALALLVPWLILVQSGEGLMEYGRLRWDRYALGRHFRNPYPSLLAIDPIGTLTPTRDQAVMWLQQVALLVPLFLLTSAARGLVRSRRRREPAPAAVYKVVVAAALLGIAESRLFLDPPYVTLFAPLAAGLSTRLLPGRPCARFWPALQWAVVLPLLAVTVVATFVFVRSTQIFTPWRLAARVPDTFTQLLASPPIDGFAPLDEVLSFDRTNWNAQEVHAVQVLMRYVHDCTAPGDRVLVTGQTPFQVGYYVNRPIAGGHLFWHDGWRADPMREQQSLELLQRQSVPFAYSTHDPVFDDLEAYPRIHEHFRKHYLELDGSRGRVLVDARRRPTGAFSTLGFPCFR